MRYELKAGTAKKFWDIAVTGKVVTTTYGRIGASGQQTKKTFATSAVAQRAADQLIAEQGRKGYEPATALPTPPKGQPRWELSLAFANGKKLVEDGTTYQVRLVEAAPLALSSGRIVACDPITAWNTQPFQRTVKKGTYPVTLSIAKITGRGKDERVGAAILQLAKGTPVAWEMALRPKQSLAKLKPGHSFGYVVDAGAGCFVDAAALANLELVNAIAYANDSGEGWLLPQVEEHLFTNHWAQAILDPKTKANIVLFLSGWGDGFYTSWWGLSKSRQPLCLLTDFGVYPQPRYADDAE